MTSPIPPDPYHALSVPPDADISAIRTAYRKLVLKHHPDRIQDPALKEKGKNEFQKIQQAYELLSDPTRRAKYDDSIKLAELRRHAVASHTASPRYAYSPRASPAAASASREWNSDDQAYYEVRTPRESAFDSKDRFDECPRTTSRKYADYDRPSSSKKPTSTTPHSEKTRTTSSSKHGTSPFSSLNGGVKAKAEPERKKDSRTYAREQEQRTREKTKARQDKAAQQSRRACVSEDSDSDTATRVTSSTIRPSYSQSTRRSREPEPARPPPRHQRSQSYTDYDDSESESDVSDKWQTHHSRSMDYMRRKKATEGGHHASATTVFPQTSGTYWNVRRESTEDARHNPTSPRARHEEPLSPRRPSMPSYSSAPSNLKAHVDERIPKDSSRRPSASFPIRERTAARETDHRKEMGGIPTFQRAHTMPIPKSFSSKKDSAPPRPSNLKHTETHDSGYGSSSSPQTPEMREQSPGWRPSESKTTKTTKYNVRHGVATAATASDDDERPPRRRVESDSDRRARRARSPEIYIRESRRDKSDKPSSRSKMESSRYEPHSPREPGPPPPSPLSRHGSSRDQPPFKPSDSDRDRDRYKYSTPPERVIYREPYQDAQYSTYRDLPDRRGHDHTPGSRFQESMRYPHTRRPSVY